MLKNRGLRWRSCTQGSRPVPFLGCGLAAPYPGGQPSSPHPSAHNLGAPYPEGQPSSIYLPVIWEPLYPEEQPRTPHPPARNLGAPLPRSVTKDPPRHAERNLGAPHPEERPSTFHPRDCNVGAPLPRRGAKVSPPPPTPRP